jgi:hypothetical protein
MNRPLNLIATLLTGVAGLLPIAAAHGQQIWLAPQAHSADIGAMFAPGAPWGQAAARTRVFELYGNPYIQPTPQPQINEIVAGLKQRNIALAVETGAINVGAKPAPPCGGIGRVEGYGPVPLHKLIARKIKAAGGVISYVSMDEPLFFGHYYVGKPGGQPGCQSSIPELAKLVAESLSVYIQEFPDVKIGEIEPSDVVNGGRHQGEDPRWRNDLAEFASALRSQLGRNLAFLHIDVAWDHPDGPPQAREMFTFARGLMRQNLIGDVGIIYNGTSVDHSDNEWMQAARQHIAIMEGTLGVRPDQVVIQSWNLFPTNALPESSPEALTSLVNFYAGTRMRR